jgi:hypothetical protein
MTTHQRTCTIYWYRCITTCFLKLKKFASIFKINFKMMHHRSRQSLSPKETSTMHVQASKQCHVHCQLYPPHTSNTNMHATQRNAYIYIYTNIMRHAPSVSLRTRRGRHPCPPRPPPPPRSPPRSPRPVPWTPRSETWRWCGACEQRTAPCPAG